MENVGKTSYEKKLVLGVSKSKPLRSDFLVYPSTKQLVDKRIQYD